MSELDLYKRQGFAQNVGIIQDAIDRSVDVLAFTRKAPELLKRTETSPLSQIVDQVRPIPDEPVICTSAKPRHSSGCVGGRTIASEEAKLFDMDQKYADLMTRTEVMVASAVRPRG